MRILYADSSYRIRRTFRVNLRGIAIAIQCVILGILGQGLGTKVVAAAYQKPCTDVRIYFRNVLAHAKLIEQKDSRSEAQKTRELQKTGELLQAASANRHCLFNALSESEAFSLVKALCSLYATFEEKSDSEQILLWDSFLKHFPHSPHGDEVRWLRAKTAATPYEYEGYADAALQQIKAIEAFIKRYPANSYLPEAELELAKACRIAYETFRYGYGLSTAPNNDQQIIGRRYRNRARQLLQHLCDHSSDPVRQDACRALKDLEAGKCVYTGPGSPNSDFPDNWAVPRTK